METARTLSSIFYILGWIVVVVAVLFGLALLVPALFALGRSGGVSDFISALTSVVTLCIASLWPFFCGAVLEALLEIHAAGQLSSRQQRVLDR